MEEQKNIEPPVSSKKRPKWLRALESQSWQAELVISGMAIFGTLQLPELINNLVDLCLFNLPEKYMSIMMYFFIYLFIAANILIISFITHLSLRALWIGMLGLVSVYPNGINPDYDYFSKDYMQKYIKKFPDVNEFNKRLDDLCSSIFATAAGSTIVMVMISFAIGILLLVSGLVTWLIPSIKVMTVFVVCVAIFFSLIIFVGILNLKQLREKEWVKKIHFPLAIGLGKVMNNIALEPMSYIQMTFMSNSKMKKYFSANMLILIIAIIVVFPSLLKSNMGYFPNDNYFNYRTTSSYIFAEKYENLFPENKSIIAPLIPSDIIEGSTIRLFIPWLKREQGFANELCGEFVAEENMDRRESRRAESQYLVDCCQKYFQIYLNDKLLTDLKFYQHIHSNNSEDGFLTYLSTKNCTPLENVIKIISHYKNKEGKMRETQIPFIFEGK